MTLQVAIERKSYRAHGGKGETLILKDVDFRLSPREILAVVGPSGCGKTTLLKIVGGLDRDYAGRIAWAGGGEPRIGTVFQEPRLLPWRTVRQNIDLVLPAGANLEAMEDLLDVLGLEPFQDAYPAQISLGMARRAAIARAFAIAPEIVLLDEPFVSLDPAMAERGRGVLLAAWTRRPTAALLVTHDLVEAASLADRVLILSGSPATILADIKAPEAVCRVGGEAAIRFADEIRGVAAGAASTVAGSALSSL